MDKTKTAPSGNWAQLQKASINSSHLFPKLTQHITEPRPYKRDSKSAPSSSGSNAGPSRGIGQYMGRVEVAANAKTTISLPQPVPSHRDMMRGNATVKEPCVLLENPSGDHFVEELRHMVMGNHVLSESQKLPGQYLAIDCEMVGVGPQGSESVLARVSIVNYHGHIILDTFVQPREPVTDYRTWISGVRAQDLITGRDFADVGKEVAELLEGKVLVGHAIENDLKALMLAHPGPLTRDTQAYKGLREKLNNKRPGLAKASQQLLGIQIQTGAHSSVIDARVTMAIYRLFKKEWEKSVWHLTEAYRNKHKGAQPEAAPAEEEGSAEEDSTSAPELFPSSSSHTNPKTSGQRTGKKKSKQQEFPGGGRKGISSGLSVIVRRGGKRVGGTGRGDGSRRMDRDRGAEAGRASSGGSGGNWWESA
ncbi:hypothetical protein B9479_003395 [Cryptococcus floricola]|uniref:RNA exonuclease 4 n=1 Tax=Cryptococcus floricola TaxID=2591691 RepID=A0A5D3AYD6_9TREE|nr:hypothetical protein B9479_003395 [Cryptococcus floricola]